MNAKYKKVTANIAILVVYLLSVTVGMSLLFISVWGDVEASTFDANLRGEKRIGTLACPVLITPRDQEMISAEFSNPIDRKINSAVRVHISSGFLTLMREENEKFSLAPAESQKLAWTVNPDDAAYGKIILVKVFLFPNHPLPSRHGTCGIYVLDLPNFTGKQVVIAAMAASFLGLVMGTSLWKANNTPTKPKAEEVFRAMLIISGFVIAGLITSLLGWWLLGGFALIGAGLALVGTLAQMLK